MHLFLLHFSETESNDVCPVWTNRQRGAVLQPLRDHQQGHRVARAARRGRHQRLDGFLRVCILLVSVRRYSAAPRSRAPRKAAGRGRRFLKRLRALSHTCAPSHTRHGVPSHTCASSHACRRLILFFIIGGILLLRCDEVQGAKDVGRASDAGKLASFARRLSTGGGGGGGSSDSASIQPA